MARQSPEESYKARLVTTERRAWLRPMTTGEIIDTALRIYQRSAWLILRLTVAPVLLCYAALVFVETLIVPGLFTTQARGNIAGEIGELLGVIAIGVLIAAPLFSLGLGWSTGITVNISRSLLHSSPIDEEVAKGVGLRAMSAVSRALVLVLVTCMIGILIAGVFMLLGMSLERNSALGEVGATGSTLIAIFSLVVGVCTLPITWNSRALAPVVTVIENVSARDSVRRSKRLMGYHKGQPSAAMTTFSVAFVWLLVGLPLWLSLSSILELTGFPKMLASGGAGVGQLFEGMVFGIASFITLWLLLPLWSIAMTVLYYDRVVRIEAYDVRLILEDTKRETSRSVLLR